MSAALSHDSSLTVLPVARASLSQALRRGLAGLAALAGPQRYRPERHYMRGGTTAGSRSLAAAHRRIAGQG